MPLGEEQTKLAATLKQILLSRLEGNTLVLPVLPKVAQELKQTLEDPAVDISKLTKQIDRDPILAAHVLKEANSESNLASGKIESFSKAASHLGLESLKTLLTTTISRTFFVSHDPRINSTVQALADHCQAVALLARNVAVLSGCRESEPAYVAGLLHDIGKLVVASYLLEFERSLPTREAMDWIEHDDWLNILQELHRPVGTAIVEAWGLPAICNKLMVEADDYDTSERISPVNTVLFSNALAKREGIYEGYPDHDSINSMIMVGKSVLGLDDTAISGITREISNHIFNENSL